MEIKKIGLIGAGAIGAYFLWGMRALPREDICIIAEGERKKRIIKEGVIINGERYDYPVKAPNETEKVDLLLVATKYGALPEVLEDIKKVIKADTIILSLLNGIDSEEIIGEAVGYEHMLYSVMRISAERKGNVVFFDPIVTMGLWYGEKNQSEMTEKTKSVWNFFKKTTCNCTFKPNIISEVWYKYAINISRNLPQAVLNVGMGAYDDSQHVAFLSHKLWEEVEAVAKAKGILIPPKEFQKCERKSACLSTLQDLRSRRHTEIDMFAGAMIKMGRCTGVEVPYCEYTYHVIKSLEEKNDGKFEYEDQTF